MTDMQLKIYDSIKLEAKHQIESGDSTVFNLFKYLIRLREASISPELFLDDYKDGSGKLNELSILLDELIIDKHKIIIFSQFVKALNLIEGMLKKKNINYLMITGKTSAKSRIDIVDEFNASNNVEIILISLKAGGTVLNLTSADTVIHLDPWWNLAVENQATDRAHRIGQTKNVRVIKMISEGSVEERVIDLQNRKRDLFESVVEDNASDLGKLTEEDIKYILS